MAYKLLFPALFVTLTGCISVQDQHAAVDRRAAYDFNCPYEKIVSTQLQHDSFGAEGCGKKQVYTVRGTSVYIEGAAPDPVYVQPTYGFNAGYYRFR